MSDNSMYEYQLTQKSIGPDIYFDEKEELKDNISTAIPYVRLLFSMFIDASKGDMNHLQTIMCLFAGHSLREVSVWNKKSHESNRSVLEGLKKDFPELYEIIKSQRYKIPVINPTCSQKRYELYDKETGKTTYFNSLKKISEKYNICYSYLKKYKKTKLIHKRFILKRISDSSVTNVI